jgi:hypothetical protein
MHTLHLGQNLVHFFALSLQCILKFVYLSQVCVDGPVLLRQLLLELERSVLIEWTHGHKWDMDGWTNG